MGIIWIFCYYNYYYQCFLTYMKMFPCSADLDTDQGNI